MASIETTNVGKAVAARVGSNIREVRTKLSLTQSQLASPEFSISYISAIERGKIRPSLKALSILAKRLDVPLTFLLEGSPGGAAEARALAIRPPIQAPISASMSNCYRRLSCSSSIIFRRQVNC